MEALNESIRALTTQEQWDGGVALFEGGAVMNVRITSKLANAKVASEHGRFENVTVNNRNDFLVGRCTCNLHTQWCKHEIALLLLISKEEPEFLKNLETIKLDGQQDDPQEQDGAPQSDEIGEAPEADVADGASEADDNFRQLSNDNDCQAFAVESFRKIFAFPSSPASIRLTCTTELPPLLLSTQRVSFTGAFLYKGGEYALANIQKLVDGARASGDMRLDMFSLQAQQAMLFIVKHAKILNSGFSLKGEQLADFFHCLVGSNILSTPSGAVRITTGLPSLVFIVKERTSESVTVEFAVDIINRGLLSKDDLHIITGRGGYWFGSKNEYWWLPSFIPFNWLLKFINGCSMQIAPNELSNIILRTENMPMRVKVLFQDRPEMTEMPVGKMKPILTLDWHTEGLVADLQFEYGGKRVEPYGKQILWVDNHFVQRDLKAEEAAMEELRGYGFMQSNDTWYGLYIRNKERIYNFITRVGMNLQPRWHTYWTPQIRLKAMMASDAKLSVSAGKESEVWFETECDLQASDGTPVPFNLAVEAIENDDHYIRLPNGAVVHLTDEVFMLLRMMLKHATERHGGKMSFEKAQSVVLSETLAPYWQGEKPDWYSLREYLQHPERIQKLVNVRLLPKTLRAYQREGIKWLMLLENNGLSGILADEMGLGKTIQALAMLLLRKKTGMSYGASMVVCPTSLIENWQNEAEHFTPALRTIVISGRERVSSFAVIQECDLVITSYALLRRDILDYEEMEFDYVILDEAQHIKNPRTTNAQVCRELRSRHRLLLTGTPLENSLSDIWSLFAFLAPGYLGSMREFRQDYERKCDAEKKQMLTQRLAAVVRPFVLRRTKAEVCAELPPKLEQNLYCEMGGEQRRLYDSILLAARAFLGKIKSSELNWNEQSMEMLAMILRLRQVCLHPALLPNEFREGFHDDIPSVKMELAKEVILESIDSNHRILFFSQFTGVINMFPEWLESAKIPFELIDGNTRDRQARVDRFNSDESISVFLLSLKAGGLGLNLQGADTVIHFDQWWNPMVEDQATDRSHRIGQTRTVNSIRLVTKNTIEEKILKLQDAKRQLFNDVIGNSASSISELNLDDVNFILS